jgi:hypothetical protein
MQDILVIILFVAALAYVGLKVGRSFTTKGCAKGCGGACSSIQPNQNAR